MAIEQVQSFKSSDGTLFGSYAAAAQREAELALSKFCQEQSYSGIRAEGIAELLTENAELVIAMLQRLANPAQLGVPEPYLSVLLQQIRRDGVGDEAKAHLARIGAPQGDYVLRIPLDVPELMDITQVRTGQVLNHALAVYPVTVEDGSDETRFVCIVEAYHPETRAPQGPFGQLVEHSADVQRIVRDVLLSMAK